MLEYNYLDIAKLLFVFVIVNVAAPYNYELVAAGMGAEVADVGNLVLVGRIVELEVLGVCIGFSVAGSLNCIALEHNGHGVFNRLSSTIFISVCEIIILFYRTFTCRSELTANSILRIFNLTLCHYSPGRSIADLAGVCGSFGLGPKRFLGLFVNRTECRHLYYHSLTAVTYEFSNTVSLIRGLSRPRIELKLVSHRLAGEHEFAAICAVGNCGMLVICFNHFHKVLMVAPYSYKLIGIFNTVLFAFYAGDVSLAPIAAVNGNVAEEVEKLVVCFVYIIFVLDLVAVGILMSGHTNVYAVEVIYGVCILLVEVEDTFLIAGLLFLNVIADSVVKSFELEVGGDLSIFFTGNNLDEVNALCAFGLCGYALVSAIVNYIVQSVFVRIGLAVELSGNADVVVAELGVGNFLKPLAHLAICLAVSCACGSGAGICFIVVVDVAFGIFNEAVSYLVCYSNVVTADRALDVAKSAALRAGLGNVAEEVDELEQRIALVDGINRFNLFRLGRALEVGYIVTARRACVLYGLDAVNIAVCKFNGMIVTVCGSEFEHLGVSFAFGSRVGDSNFNYFLGALGTGRLNGLGYSGNGALGGFDLIAKFASGLNGYLVADSKVCESKFNFLGRFAFDNGLGEHGRFGVELVSFGIGIVAYADNYFAVPYGVGNDLARYGSTECAIFLIGLTDVVALDSPVFGSGAGSFVVLNCRVVDVGYRLTVYGVIAVNVDEQVFIAICAREVNRALVGSALKVGDLGALVIDVAEDLEAFELEQVVVALEQTVDLYIGKVLGAVVVEVSENAVRTAGLNNFLSGLIVEGNGERLAVGELNLCGAAVLNAVYGELFALCKRVCKLIGGVFVAAAVVGGISIVNSVCAGAGYSLTVDGSYCSKLELGKSYNYFFVAYVAAAGERTGGSRGGLYNSPAVNEVALDLGNRFAVVNVFANVADVNIDSAVFANVFTFGIYGVSNIVVAERIAGRRTVYYHAADLALFSVLVSRSRAGSTDLVYLYHLVTSFVANYLGITALGAYVEVNAVGNFPLAVYKLSSVLLKNPGIHGGNFFALFVGRLMIARFGAIAAKAFLGEVELVLGAGFVVHGDDELAVYDVYVLDAYAVGTGRAGRAGRAGSTVVAVFTVGTGLTVFAVSAGFTGGTGGADYVAKRFFGIIGIDDPKHAVSDFELFDSFTGTAGKTESKSNSAAYDAQQHKQLDKH